MIASSRPVKFSLLHSFYVWSIVACGMLFYCYNYFLRVSPSVMQNELAQAFHINASHFGALAAFYYYAYTPMQIPAGLLYDKFGVRFVLFFSCLIAVCGLSLFVKADQYYLASFGRFMIGLGGAFAYIGTLKLASLWLPNKRFATVAGITTAVGMASGAFAQKYFSHVIEEIGYQKALHNVLIGGIILSLIILVFVRNRTSNPDQSSQNHEMGSPMTFQQLISAVRIIFTNPQMWLIGIIGCLLYLPSSVFLDGWGIPYLKAVYNISPKEAVNISNFTFYGWIISGPLICAFSDKIKRRKLPLIIFGFFGALLLCMVFFIPNLTLAQLYLIFFLSGFFCGAHPICFALGKENNPIQISGTAVAVTNMLIMAGGAIFLPAVGLLLDLHSNKMLDANGLRIYSGSDYTFALSVVPIGVAIGIFLCLFLKETYAESKASTMEQELFNSTPLGSTKEAHETI